MKNCLTNWSIKSLFLFTIYITNARWVNANNLSWHDVEVKAQNAVVQVWAQKAEFNWLEPYKSPKLYEAAGTAFFINENGDLLTNFHVVSECQSVFINVPICGRKPLEVEIKGVCPELDVALMTLTKESYYYLMNILEERGFHQVPFLKLGDSDSLYRTEPVLALGFPLGQRYLKSTVGVIAGRDFMFGESYIHITAPINPGNSGGPLLNLKGEVVGINTALVPNAQIIGFIRPINDAKNILDYLNVMKLYKKPELGISINHATAEHATFLKNPTPGGVYINFVYNDSIAQKAGIKVGDMLYEVIWNGESYKIDEYGDLEVDWRSSDKISLEEFFHRFRLSDPVTLIIYRYGEKLEIKCNFDAPPDYPVRRVFPDFEPESKKDYEIFAGGVFMQLRLNHLKDLHYRDVLPEQAQLYLKKYYSPEFRAEEVVIITSILPGSQLHKVDCFRIGEIVEEVNSKKVKNIQDLREALLLSVDSGNIAIKTKEGVFTVLSLNKVLDEEFKLSNGYIFPISQTIKKIAQLVNKAI